MGKFCLCGSSKVSRPSTSTTVAQYQFLGPGLGTNASANPDLDPIATLRWIPGFFVMFTKFCLFLGYV